MTSELRTQLLYRTVFLPDPPFPTTGFQHRAELPPILALKPPLLVVDLAFRPPFPLAERRYPKLQYGRMEGGNAGTE
jgi:hypothetical protein